MTNIPQVRNDIEVQVLNHTFRFRRLKWHELTGVTQWLKRGVSDRISFASHALYEISGKSLSPDEALQVLKTLPKIARDMLFLYYKGSLDPHRFFDAPTLWRAPQAVQYQKALAEEESEADQGIDEVEEMLRQKFGQRAVDEEREISNLIVANSGYKGAIRKEEEESEKAHRIANTEDPW